MRSDGQEGKDQRQPRCRLRRDAELQLKNNVVIKGHTEDVGVGGLFLTIVAGGATPQVGEQGTLRLSAPHQEMVEMRCRVAHVRANGVGLEVDTSDGRFGLIVSTDIYLDLQKSVGMAIPSRVYVRVELTLSEGRKISGRVTNLGKDCFVFLNMLNEMALLPVGASVEVVLSCNRATDVAGKGYVRSHRFVEETESTGRRKKSDYCTVGFRPLTEDIRRSIDAFLNVIQEEEIWGRMKQRASSHAVKNYQTTPEEKKSVQEIYQDFNKFFGFKS